MACAISTPMFSDSQVGRASTRHYLFLLVAMQLRTCIIHVRVDIVPGARQSPISETRDPQDSFAKTGMTDSSTVALDQGG